MKKIGRCFRRLGRRLCRAGIAPVAGAAGLAAFLMISSAAFAQDQKPAAEVPTPSHMTVPDGYTAHHSIDLGGRKTFVSGSQAFYDTLVNYHDGPRVLGENFEMRANPGTNQKLDYLKAFGTGFGGDPYNFAKLSASKAKYFDFNGMFRRSRQYWDYDLLGNSNIVPQSVPVGPSNSPTGSIPWGPVNQSPVLFNTVRRLLDTDVTLFPLNPLRMRLAYSHTSMEGPTLSPSGYQIMKYDGIFREYQRNGSDDYTAGIDFRPDPLTTLSVEQHFNHYKYDSTFTLNPNSFQAVEADGTPVYLGNWDNQNPYGIGACNTGSMGAGYTDSTHYTIFSPSNSYGGKPIINAACAVYTSYMRSAPTRVTIPTSVVRFQSSRIQNVAINGDFRYTLGTMNMPNYYEDAQGLNGSVREVTATGGMGRAHRQVVAADFGLVWKATKSISIAEQVDLSSTAQPSYVTNAPYATLATPSTAGNQTINYGGSLIPGTLTPPHGYYVGRNLGYFGQSFLTNNITLSWDVDPRTVVSLNYRFQQHNIGEGTPHKGLVQETDPESGEVKIQGNGAGLNVAYRPVTNLQLNASAEYFYNDSALTPWTPRQDLHYRVRANYKPGKWTTLTVAYNDRERHNNTNNQEEEIAAGEVKYFGPVNHVDSYRVGSAGVVIAPNENYSIDMNYSYSDTFAATNVCFNPGNSAKFPGTATTTGSGAPNICPGIYGRGTTNTVDYFTRDFEEQPVQYGSIAFTARPSENAKMRIGYNVTSSDGTRTYMDARDVSGTLLSKYQTPFASVEYKITQGLSWKGEYNYYNYQENGPGFATSCSTTATTTGTVVPCSTLSNTAASLNNVSGFTADRKFRANNITLGFHYEF